MNSRYIVVNGSETSHCCFEATVVDTAKVEWTYNDIKHYRSICECFSIEDAEIIAAALNKGAVAER